MGCEVGWGDCWGVVSVDDDVGLRCVDGLGEFLLHGFFVDYGGFAFFVFAEG